MTIAGVHFSLTCDEKIQIAAAEAAYESFQGKAADEEEALVLKIRLQLGPMPEVRNLEKIFDTGQSWVLYRAGDRYWLSFHPAQCESPFWIACFGQEADEVTVYCSPLYVRKKNGKKILHNPVCYPLDQILLMYFLARRQGLLAHAAGIGVGGKAVIFPGQSGAGKSTLSRLFARNSKWELLSDERMVVRKIRENFQAFGTPWPGTEGIARNRSAPLCALLFLAHGENHIQEIKPQDALERLLPVCSIPWYDHEVMARIILFGKDIVARVPAYEFKFKPAGAAIDFFTNFMSTLR